MPTLTPEQNKKLMEEIKYIEQKRLQHFQQKLIDNNYIVPDEMAESLLELTEEFLEEESSQ